MEDATITQPTKPKGKRSLPKSAPRKGGAVQLYAYEIKDKVVGNLMVRSTANAWWEDRQKVEKLIDAFKIGCLIDEALVYAGISYGQYKYFKEHHPEFLPIKKAAEAILDLKARQTLAKEIENNPGAAYTHLVKKENRLERQRIRKEEQEAKVAEENKVRKPNAVIFVDFGEPLPEELAALENQPFEPEVTEDGHA